MNFNFTLIEKIFDKFTYLLLCQIFFKFLHLNKNEIVIFNPYNTIWKMAHFICTRVFRVQSLFYLFKVV